ncbi:MAG: hypothetical protein B7Z08_01880 [Sphingomonadales bacterium 32-68-7]|nr:MAG: hypothetical protein B7Z33_08075 [Sphingomonadales bacterium 12-68-11]OYX10240.1 MAG: hypothetical protein B7Z08_01880 [Sphingomonadales bacterium 32-68-7]
MPALSGVPHRTLGSIIRPSVVPRKSGATSILIVEDQLMIADMTEDYLLRNGYEVCGIARTVDEAVALGLLHKPDLAVLDLRLADGGLGTEVAAQLESLTNLGILYVTGNMSEVVLTSDNGHACLNKPYRLVDLMVALEIVIELVDTTLTALPLPRGFRILPPAAIA